MTRHTTTLFKYIHSELNKKGLSEFEGKEKPVDFSPFGKFVFFDPDYQHTEKILNFDDDVSEITNYIFHGLKLSNPDHDKIFKKNFILRFANREIGRQTIEAFKMELGNIFLTNKNFIESVFNDLEKYILSTGINEGLTNSKGESNNNTVSVNDTRNAFSDLPQNQVNIDVDNTSLPYATDNTINRSKGDSETVANNNSETSNKNTAVSYSLDMLLKSSLVMEDIFNRFDRKCFLQIW